MVPRAPTYRRRRPSAVQAALGVEYKYFDAVKTATVFSTSWVGGELDPAASCLGVPTQGVTASSRDGSRIVCKSLQLQGRVYRAVGPDSVDSRQGAVCQLALVMDTRTNGAQLNAEDVYTSTDPEVPGYRVIANSSRFKVLRTEYFDMVDTSAMTDGASTASITGSVHHFSWHLKMNQVMNFIDGGGAGAVADLKDISFHLIGCTSSGNYDFVEYNFRMKFIG